MIDGYKGEISECNLTKGKGCPVCYGRTTLKGINDLWTTNPEIAKLLKYPEIGYEVSHGINHLQIFKCLICGNEKSLNINSVIKNGFSCSICGDGVSYPNKFIRAFLEQLNEEYIPEYSPSWACGKKYDNYLINRNEIWEIHGLQHYKDVNWSRYGSRTLKEEQENDIIKKILAENNGCKYVIIDARYSDMEYIKNSILKLPEIKRYDLSKIDWLKCHEFTCSSLIKIACDYWNSGIKSALEISKLMKLHRTTIYKYLKKGVLIGWCDYNTKK